MTRTIDILPLAACARRVGVSYPWLKTLALRGRVRTVRDRAGRLYVPMPEVARLSARYQRHRTREGGRGEQSQHEAAPVR